MKTAAPSLLVIIREWRRDLADVAQDEPGRSWAPNHCALLCYFYNDMTNPRTYWTEREHRTRRAAAQWARAQLVRHFGPEWHPRKDPTPGNWFETDSGTMRPHPNAKRVK